MASSSTGSDHRSGFTPTSSHCPTNSSPFARYGSCFVHVNTRHSNGAGPSLVKSPYCRMPIDADSRGCDLVDFRTSAHRRGVKLLTNPNWECATRAAGHFNARLSPAAVVAEKYEAIEAIVDVGMGNTRMKDHFDLHAFSCDPDTNPEQLRQWRRHLHGGVLQFQPARQSN